MLRRLLIPAVLICGVLLVGSFVIRQHDRAAFETGICRHLDEHDDILIGLLEKNPPKPGASRQKRRDYHDFLRFLRQPC